MEKLSSLLCRLASPVISSKLSKHEVCLSFAAISSLLDRSLSSRAPLHDFSLPFRQNFTLLHRIKSITLTCTSREVAMLCDGWTVIDWPRWDVVDCFVSAFSQTCGSSPLDKELLSVITSVLNSAIAANHFFNVTLARICEETLQSLTPEACQDHSVAQTIQLIACYLGSAKVRSILSSVGEEHTNLEFLSQLNDSCNRQDAFQTFSAGKANDFTWTSNTARCALLSWWEHQSKATEDGFPPHLQLKEVLNLFSYYNIQDSALQRCIEDACIDGLQTASKEDIDSLFGVVNRRLHTFPRLYQAIKLHVNEGDGENKSLRTQRAVERYYEDAINNIALPPDAIAEVLEEFQYLSYDDRAVAVLILMSGNLPDDVATHGFQDNTDISLRGSISLVLTRPLDTHGVLSSPVEHAMEFLADHLSEASEGDLLLISRGLSLPTSRYILDTSSYFSVERKLKNILLQRWAVMLSSQYLPLKALVAIGMSAGNFEETSSFLKVLFSAIDQLLKNETLNLSGVVDVIEMLTSLNEVDETLICEISSQMERQLSDTPSLLESDDLLRFSVLQSSLQAPGLLRISRTVVSAINSPSCTLTTLIAAGMLLHGNGDFSGLNSVVHHILRRINELDLVTLPYLLQLLYKAHKVIPCTQDLVAHLAPHVSLYIATPLRSTVLQITRNVACYLVVKAACDADTVISEPVLQMCCTHLSSLPTDIYMQLLLSVPKCDNWERLSHAYVASFPRMLNRLTAEQISDGIFSIGQLPNSGKLLSHQIVGDTCSDYVVDLCNIFSCGKTIARMLHGFSCLHITKKSLYRVFSERLNRRSIIATLDRNAISLSMSAFGKAKFLNQALFNKFSRVFKSHMTDLGVYDLLFSINAMSRVMLADHSFYQQAGDQILSKLEELPTSSLCELLHAFGSMDVSHKSISEKITSLLSLRLEELPDANVAASVLVSLCRMKHNIRDDANATSIVEYITTNVEQLSVHGVLELCAALDDSEWRNVAALRSLASHSVSLQKNEQLSPICGRAVLDLLEKNYIYHPEARKQLTSLARIISRDVVTLSEDETLEHQLLISR